MLLLFRQRETTSRTMSYLEFRKGKQGHTERQCLPVRCSMSVRAGVCRKNRRHTLVQSHARKRVEWREEG